MKLSQKIKNLFAEKQPKTNSNKFDVYTKMEVQEQIDKRTLDSQATGLPISTFNQMSNSIRDKAQLYIHNKNLDPYFLLQYQANYFCGTCKFETEDLLLKQNILNTIRGAFLLGCAGMYYEDGIGQPVYINQLQYKVDGNIKACRIMPLNLCLQKMNEYKTSIENFNLTGFRDLNEEQCKNLAVFSWGIMGYSAWITHWPLVNLQHQLLTMIIINSYVFNRKWEYRLNNISTVDTEIELFFNQENPFIVNLGNTDDIANRFILTELAKGGNQTDIIDFYNKTMAAYYQIIGRQVNLDVKKERNVTNEVEASQENFDIVQSDWLLQFDMYIKKVKELSGIEIYTVQEKEQEEQNNDSEGMSQPGKDEPAN